MCSDSISITYTHLIINSYRSKIAVHILLFTNIYTKFLWSNFKMFAISFPINDKKGFRGKPRKPWIYLGWAVRSILLDDASYTAWTYCTSTFTDCRWHLQPAFSLILSHFCYNTKCENEVKIGSFKIFVVKLWSHHRSIYTVTAASSSIIFSTGYFHAD